MPNNNQLFNPESYKELLSPFGCKVLDFMNTQWKQDQDRNRKLEEQREYSRMVKNRRTLTFEDSRIISDNSSICNSKHTGSEAINKAMMNNDEQCNFENSHTINRVPTARELINTLDRKSNEASNSSSREDLLKSLEFANKKTFQISDKPKDLILEMCNQNSNDNYVQCLEQRSVNVTKFDSKNSSRPDNNSVIVNWDNMIDFTILPEVDNNSGFVRNNIKDKKLDYLNTLLNDTIIPDPISKTVKKRKQQSKITDTVIKKVKKPLDIKARKNTERKEKYTKTVKKWFDKSETAPIEKKIEDCDEKVDSIDFTKPTKEKAPKKIIQSRLANKDGIMKFRIPNSINNENALPHDDNKPTIKLTNIINNATDEKKQKEKKTISKFVAPIKSQIPVSDVTYDIIKINQLNFAEYLEFPNNANEDYEATLTLIYSNGFCQLNNQHTDDTCKVEGLMIYLGNTIYYMKHVDFVDKNEVRHWLLSVLNNTRTICYDGKSLLIYLAIEYNLDYGLVQLNIIDTKIGVSLLNPDEPSVTFSVLQKSLHYTPEYTIATDCVLQKSAWYLTLLQECANKLITTLTEQSLWSVFVNIEMRLCLLIADMEHRGVSLDLENLKKMDNILINKIKDVEQECYLAAGKTFQINSTVQVRSILYDELKLDSKNNVKIRETITTGAKSTSETMLKSLMFVHPLPRLILEYRHLHKAHATFVAGILQHVRDGLVKPTWDQTAAVTGRIASNNPNLQAIPKAAFSLVMFPEDKSSAEKETQDLKLNFRSVYVARNGFKLLAADFQHIECRVFAHLAEDTSLLEILKSEGDLFRVLASKWLNKPECEVSSEDRERTKRIIYASLYGAGTRKLMEILDISYEQTLSIISSFNRTFPSLKAFGRSVVSRCEANEGRLYTLCGRARHIKHINSNEFTLKSQAERQAVNFMIQGSAADLCKIAMILTAEHINSARPPIEGHLILQIHDELVWEFKDSDVERATGIIRSVMENCGQHCGLSVKLPVAMSCGRSWGMMESIK